MFPAYSVILFTTLSGAGYGLAIWLAGARLAGALPATPAFGFAGMGLALALITAGLLMSTAHLGHPERAWRALSQWRTSWLSREGVAAVFAYAPLGLFALDWLLGFGSAALTSVLAILVILLSLATIWCTGMIYASLRTIPQWNNSLVTPLYILMALATGGLLFMAIASFAPGGQPFFKAAAVAAIVLAGGGKHLYWTQISGAPPRFNAAQALGLKEGARVETLEAPSTQPSFVQREMGYAVGRKHAQKLRLIALAMFVLAPLAIFALDAVLGFRLAWLWYGAAALSGLIGVFVERWLFFAEAQHVSMLYFGKSTV